MREGCCGGVVSSAAPISNAPLDRWFLQSAIYIGGCSYSFVNWEMLSVRPNRGMLTPSH